MKILMTSNYSLNNKKLFDLTIKNHLTKLDWNMDELSLPIADKFINQGNKL